MALNEERCRALIEERADGLCEMCGREFNTIHHRKKRSHLTKGTHWSDLANLVAVCGDGTSPGGCHSWIEFNPNMAHDMGFHVKPWETPEEQPILLHGRTWVKLLSSSPLYNYEIQPQEFT